MLPLTLALLAAAAAPPASVRTCLGLDAEPEASLEACRQAAAQPLADEWSVLVRSSLARRLAWRGEWEDVIVLYRGLAAARIDEAEWPTRLGAALLFGAGRPAEAELALREALDRDAARAESWALLGSALASRRRFAEAVGAIERALALEPGLLDARPALSEILAAARRGEAWP